MTETTCDRVQHAIIEGIELSTLLEAHRAVCDECRFVAALSRDLGSSGASRSVPDVAVDLAIGTPLAGRYRIDALIGRGGQGQVYRALDLETHEVIALKLVRLLDGKESTAETANARRVRHPNICRVYHTERLGDHRLVVMEYIPGPTLAERLGKLSRGDVVRIYIGICRAVQAAHEAGVLHLDLKPQNVLLRDGREPIVTDFGLSQRSEQAAGGSGTPRYMSPEQRSAAAVDHRADIYALGRILEDLVGGHSWRLTRVARRASAEDPARRPADVGALLRAVEAPVGWRRRVQRAALGLVVLLCLLALAPLVVPTPAGRRAVWRTDTWDPDPLPPDAWNIALNVSGASLPSIETPDRLWGCAQRPSDLLDGRVQYGMWEHGIAWPLPPNRQHPDFSCVRLLSAPRCGVPRPQDRLCELFREGGGYRVLDEHVSDVPRFPPDRQELLGVATPKLPCGERSVTVHLDRAWKVMAVRVWYREIPPRIFRVELWDRAGQMQETSVLDNRIGRDPRNWPPARETAYSFPVTTETTEVVTDRIRLVIDTCSTIEDDELAAYRAGKGDKVPNGGWLYEFEVFSRLSRYQAWRRSIFD